jgi:hypothetical protein
MIISGLTAKNNRVLMLYRRFIIGAAGLKMEMMLSRSAFSALLLASAVSAQQKYTGPHPPKPDLPCLVHADTLVPTEAAEAKEQKGKKEEITYIVAGATSSVKTPLASPIFLVETQQLAADKLQLYKLESKNGQRQVSFSPKKRNSAQPILMDVKTVGPSLYRLEVEQTLQPGEYALTPEGTNQVFCFAIF